MFRLLLKVALLWDATSINSSITSSFSFKIGDGDDHDDNVSSTFCSDDDEG